MTSRAGTLADQNPAGVSGHRLTRGGVEGRRGEDRVSHLAPSGPGLPRPVGERRGRGVVRPPRAEPMGRHHRDLAAAFADLVGWTWVGQSTSSRRPTGTTAPTTGTRTAGMAEGVPRRRALSTMPSALSRSRRLDERRTVVASAVLQKAAESFSPTSLAPAPGHRVDVEVLARSHTVSQRRSGSWPADRSAIR